MIYSILVLFLYHKHFKHDMYVDDLDQLHGFFLNLNCMHFHLQRVSLAETKLNPYVKS